MLVQPIVAPLIQMVRNTRCCFTGGSKLRSFSYSALVVSLALLGSAMPATAAAGAPSNALKAAFDQAHRAEAANRSGEAIEALKRAYELSGDTEILFRLAEMTRKAGQDVSALRFYRAYLARDPRGKHRAVAERQAQLLEIASAQSGSAPAAGATALAPPPFASPYTQASAAAPGGESRPWETPTNAPPAAAPKTFGSPAPSAIAGGQSSAPSPLALATTPPPMTNYPSSPSVDLAPIARLLPPPGSSRLCLDGFPGRGSPRPWRSGPERRSRGSVPRTITMISTTRVAPRRLAAPALRLMTCAREPEPPRCSGSGRA